MTFIASAMSPAQRELISKLPSDKAVYVEGGYFVWLRSKSLIYFVLRSKTTNTCTKFEEVKNEEDFDSEYLMTLGLVFKHQTQGSSNNMFT